MKRHPFRLPPFQRIAWTSAAARLRWQRAIETAHDGSAQRLLEAVAQGVLPCALLEASEVRVPLLLRTASERGLEALPIAAPAAAPVWLLPAPASNRLLLAVCPRGKLASHRETFAHAPLSELLLSLGWPRCCADTHARHDFSDPSWACALASEGKTIGPSASHPFLRPLGVRGVPHVPCRLDCAASRELANQLRTQEDQDAMLDWPLTWSALHGIAEVCTPAFRLVYDTDGSTDRLVRELTSCA